MACTSYDCAFVLLRGRLAGKLAKKKVYAETECSVRITIVPQAPKFFKCVHVGGLRHLNADIVGQQPFPEISRICSTMVHRR